MPTANEAIRDTLTRHQISLLRFAGSLRNEMAALITGVERDMADELLRRLSRIRTGDAALTPANLRRIRALDRALAEIQAPVWKELNDTVLTQLRELADMEPGFAQRAVAGALPVFFETIMPTADTLSRIISVDPMDGKPIRQWLTEMQANDRRRINQAIRIGLARGEGSRQIATRVFGTRATGGANGVRGITRRGAAAVARTAVNHVGNQARQAFYLANRALIPQELYVATLDARTTAICQSLDGNTYVVGIGPTPPVHFACRSIRVPVVNGQILGNRPFVASTKAELSALRPDARRARIRALTGRVPATQTYQVFLKNQTVAFQNEVLGVTKGKLFRDGGLTVDKFVDRAGNELNLTQLRARESAAFEAAGL